MDDLADKACQGHLPNKMTRERYEFLMTHHDEPLTKEEIEEGFFFCCTWDGLLIHKTDEEARSCSCLKAKAYNES